MGLQPGTCSERSSGKGQRMTAGLWIFGIGYDGFEPHTHENIPVYFHVK